jgi:hypothetical protein
VGCVVVVVHPAAVGLSDAFDQACGPVIEGVGVAAYGRAGQALAQVVGVAGDDAVGVDGLQQLAQFVVQRVAGDVACGAGGLLQIAAVRISAHRGRRFRLIVDGISV